MEDSKIDKLKKFYNAKDLNDVPIQEVIFENAKINSLVNYSQAIYKAIDDLNLGPHRRDLERHYKKVLRQIAKECSTHNIDFKSFCKRYGIKEL